MASPLRFIGCALATLAFYAVATGAWFEERSGSESLSPASSSTALLKLHRLRRVWSEIELYPLLWKPIIDARRAAHQPVKYVQIGAGRGFEVRNSFTKGL